MVQFGTHVVTVYLIVQWVFFSSTIILFNKHILTGYKFPYPATLVLIHMLFASACCTTAKVLGLVDIPQLALRQWLTQILPVGLCFAVSLVLGNAAYLYISVAFVQMLKASTPVVVLLCSFAFGLEKPTFKLAGFIVLISAGISTACANEIDVSVIGVAVQMSAVGAEALRLCLVNMLLVSKGLRLSSLATLYYVAPACALCLLPPWLWWEGRPLLHHHMAPLHHVGAPLLLLNASVVVLLNLSTMALIKHTSALTLNVSGVFKDIGLILWSVYVSGAIVTPLQYVGYGVALAGVVGFSEYKRANAAASKVLPSEANAEKVPLSTADAEYTGSPALTPTR